jgi:hypothetical protein
MMSKLQTFPDVEGAYEKTCPTVRELTRVSAEEMVNRLIAASDEELANIQIAIINLQQEESNVIQRSQEQIAEYRTLARSTWAIQQNRASQAANSAGNRPNA